MKILLASALLLVSGLTCAQIDVRPEDTPKDDCPSCLAKSFRGHLAPDFELPTPDGGKLKLSDLRGQAVLLNFWCRCGANDTGASKFQIPMLAGLQNEYGPQGLQVVGVSLDDYATTEEISDYAREMNVNYPIVIGKTSSFEKQYRGVFFLPMTLFIDREGRVIAREIGVGSRSRYVDLIRRSLRLDAVPQSNVPCSGQPTSRVELAAAFQQGRLPTAAEATGTWVEIGSLSDYPSSPPYRSLDCSGVSRKGTFEFVLIANGYSVELHAVGMTHPQSTNFQSDKKESVTFLVDFSNDNESDKYRCRLTQRNTLACLSGQHSGLEFKKMIVVPSQVYNVPQEH